MKHRRATVFEDVPIPGTTQRADIHLPSEIGRETHILVNVHGGGWYTGDKSLTTRCCEELARRGLIVVNANHSMRADDPVPLMVSDTVAALVWVRSGAGLPDELCAAAANGVALSGDSAGAHVAVMASAALHDPALAALLGLNSRFRPTAPDVSAVVSWSGALSLADLVVDHGHPESERFAGYMRSIAGDSRNRLADLDPMSWIDARMPPLLAFTSALDFFHDSTMSYVAAMRAVGGGVTKIGYDYAHTACKHSWQLDPALPESQETYDITAAFVRAQL